MKLLIAAVGKLKAGPERELYDRYAERATQAGRALGLGPVTTAELPESRAGSACARMDDEAARLLARVGDDGFRIVLAETGRAVTSRAFADLIAGNRDRGTQQLCFLIGGADGHGAAVSREAQFVLSLGPMTLPHGLARIVLAEQLYRAVTILSGHPYHRG